MVIGGNLDPKEEDFEAAVACALRQLILSMRALDADWTGPPGVTS